MPRRPTSPSCKTTTDGNYGGLGLTVSSEDGAVKVITPTEDTPADRAGIKAGDYITHIDGEFLYGFSLDEAVEKMRGKPGTHDQADHRPPRPRQAVRRRHHPRADRAEAGQVGSQGQHRHHQHQRLLGPDRRADPRGADRRSTRRPAAGRSAISSTCAPTPAACSTRRSRSATPSSTQGEIVSERGREKDDIERFYAKPGDLAHGLPVDRAGRRRLGLGGGDRRRRAAGPSPRDRHGRAQLRQGLGPDRAPDRARRRRCA